ncbi:MAG: glycosyltransferase family 2 protein [Candidatus Omnitrophica bacterium]|nr:glycosyltransferase family 2 protein [Candidatus Omnitrophota bacterium]
MPEVSVIIVTHNSLSTIKSCLDSVRSQSYEDIEVILVDNDSRDGIGDFLKSHYAEIRLIENKENLGFAKANNQGIFLSKAKYVLTLNPDAVLDKDFIFTIMEFIKKEKNSQIGMISGKLLRMQGILDSTGLVLTRFRRFFDRGSGEMDNGKYNRAERVFGPCAAAAFYKRDMLEDVRIDHEYFDEDFFCFVEDVDLAWRANKKGWLCYYLPEASCFHSRGSGRYKKSLVQYHSFRNRYFMNVKNDRFNIFTVPSILFYDLPRLLFMLFTNPLSFRAVKDIIYYTPKMLGKRKIYSRCL